MAIQLRNSLNEDEYDAFEQLFLTFDIQKKDVINSDVKDVRAEFNKQYRELSLKYHPDKNPGNKEAEQKFKFIALNKPFFKDFIIEPLEKGLSKRNNLVKELRNKLWSCNYKELQKYLDDKSRNKLSNKQQSMNKSIIAYSQLAGILSIPGEILKFVLPIVFFYKNGILFNIPLALGFFVPLLIGTIARAYIGKIYTRNNKKVNNTTVVLLLTNFDEECKDFSESDRTKLKWLKNLVVLNIITTFSLMSYGVGIDLIGNGVGIMNSMLSCGLLLSLPITLLLITGPLLGVAINNSLKKSAVEIIEEQFKGDGQCIEVANEKPSSTVDPDSAFNAAAHGMCSP